MSELELHFWEAEGFLNKDVFPHSVSFSLCSPHHLSFPCHLPSVGLNPTRKEKDPRWINVDNIERLFRKKHAFQRKWAKPHISANLKTSACPFMLQNPLCQAAVISAASQGFKHFPLMPCFYFCSQCHSQSALCPGGRFKRGSLCRSCYG